MEDYSESNVRISLPSKGRLAEDALEFIIAGATAIQVGTALRFRPLKGPGEALLRAAGAPLMALACSDVGGV